MMKIVQLCFLLLLVHLNQSFVTENSSVVFINSSKDLEAHLCSFHQTTRPLKFVLNRTSFTLSNGSFCHMSNGVIHITTNTYINSSVITCAFNAINQGRRGLVFFNSSVIIERVTFDNCGTFLTGIPDTDTIKYLNGSYFHYSAYHSAVLVFVHCTVNMTQVKITNSFGFSVIGTNLNGSLLDRLELSDNNITQPIGSGIVLQYFENHHTSSMTLSTTVIQTNILRNYVYNNYCHGGIFRARKIINAIGLTVISTLNTSKGYIFLDKVHFENSTNFGGSLPVGLLILQYNMTLKIIISNSVFKNNSNQQHQGDCKGVSIAYHCNFCFRGNTTNNNNNDYHLIFHNTSFDSQNGADSSGVIIYIGILTVEHEIISILLNGSTFVNNFGIEIKAINYGTCRDQESRIIFHNTTAISNYQYYRTIYTQVSYSVFHVSNFKYVLMSGDSYFTYNRGTILSTKDCTVIEITGNTFILFSHCIIGCGIQARGNGMLIFNSSNFNVSDTWAEELGAAIFVDLSYYDNCPVVIKNSTIYSLRNYADWSSNSMYMARLGPCYIGDTYYSTSEIYKYYNESFRIIKTNHNVRRQIATQATIVGECDKSNTNPIMYAGQTNTYIIALMDPLYRNAYSPKFYIEAVADNYLSYGMRLPGGNVETSFADEEGHNCTRLPLKILGGPMTEKMTQNEVQRGHVIFTIAISSIKLDKVIFILPCPIGFTLNNDTKSCDCTPLLNKVSPGTRCDIESLLIERPRFATNSWSGYYTYDNDTSFSIALQCPIGYCNHTQTPFCSIGSTVNLSMGYNTSLNCSEHATPLCLNDRTGPICGQCIDGYSVTVGSTKCKPCSNWWLFTLIGYAVAGPLLIFFLYALKLTLATGTLNGIIFYAQLTNVGVMDLLIVSSQDQHKVAGFFANIALVFISIINLRIGGVSICLYSGMGDLMKAGLNLVFPLYLLTIVVVVIVLSQYSLKISDRIAESSVQVLVTVIHLSFSKLLFALIDVFTSATVQTEAKNYTVWFFDGSVEYGKGSHLLLMIITLVIVTALLLPYMLILLFAKPLRRTRLNWYLRPFVEAIHAPYKEGKEYFLVFQLVFVIVLFLLYSQFRSSNIHYLYIFDNQFGAVYLIAHAYIKPYKSNAINVLDCWILLNLVFICGVSWYFLDTYDWLALQLTVTCAVLLILLTLIAIIVTHIVWIKAKRPSIKRFLNSILAVHSEQQQRPKKLYRRDISYDPNEVREPLLDSLS